MSLLFINREVFIIYKYHPSLLAINHAKLLAILKMSEFTSKPAQINPSSAHRTEAQLAAQERLQVFVELDNLRFVMKGPAATFEKSAIEILGGDSDANNDANANKQPVILV